MAADDAVVHELLSRMELAEGREAQSAIRDELTDGGEELRCSSRRPCGGSAGTRR